MAGEGKCALPVGPVAEFEAVAGTRTHCAFAVGAVHSDPRFAQMLASAKQRLGLTVAAAE
jgi:hypothetical protein